MGPRELKVVVASFVDALIGGATGRHRLKKAGPAQGDEAALSKFAWFSSAFGPIRHRPRGGFGSR